MGFRDLTEQDAPLLADLHGQSFQSGWSALEFEKLLTLNTVCGFLGLHDTLPAGFILAQVAVDQADILTFCVIPPHQRRGMGKLLLHQLQDFLTSINVSSMTLEVACDNQAALKLYTQVGFIPIGKRKNYYPPLKGTSTDAITMVWQIASP